MENFSLVQLHKKYIKGTAPKAEVIEKTITICHLTMAVFNTGHFKSRKVHINTKALKHLYDKKPAEEYDFIIHNLHLIIKFPDHIYKNKLGKIGDVVFAKKIDRVEYLCSLQFTTFTNPDSVIEEVNFAVTSYRKRDEDYLNGYKLLWSWEGGTPPS